MRSPKAKHSRSPRSRMSPMSSRFSPKHSSLMSPRSPLDVGRNKQSPIGAWKEVVSPLGSVGLGTAVSPMTRCNLADRTGIPPMSTASPAFSGHGVPPSPMTGAAPSPMAAPVHGFEGAQQAFATDILQGLNNKKFIFTISDPAEADCPLTFVSEAFVDFTGYSQEECLGKNIRFLFGPETEANTVADMDSALADGEEHRCNVLCYKKDGTTFYNQMHHCPSRDADGNVSFIVGVSQEVDANGMPLEKEMPTRAKDLMSQLQRGNNEMPELDYAGVLGDLQLEQVVCVSNPKLPDCPIIYVNQKFYDLTQRGPAEVIGLNCRFLQGPETDPEDVAEIREAVKAGRAVTTCLLNYKKDGTPFWNHLHIEPVYDRKGELTYYVASQYDVTSLMDDAIQLVKSGTSVDGQATSLGATIKKHFGDKSFEESQDDTLLSVCLHLPTDTNRGTIMKEGRKRAFPTTPTIQAAN